MPPQPGMFPIIHSSKTRMNNGSEADMGVSYHHHQHHATAGPSSRPHGAPVEDSKKDRKRREIAGRLGKEMSDRREETGRHHTEMISELISTSVQLTTRPDTLPAYNLRLYPITLERAALLTSLAMYEKHALNCVQETFEEERQRVEEEWGRGRDKIKERLLESIEERRRRAREEKEGEGASGDAAMDSQSRPHVTRKLRNKIGTSPPPTPLSVPGLNGAISSMASGPITTGPFLNPHSLSVDELPSPFPLPLTATHLTAGGYSVTTTGTSNNRRRARGGGREAQAVGGLGKSLNFLAAVKENEVEHDLGEIRRGNKRRRAAAATLVAKS